MTRPDARALDVDLVGDLAHVLETGQLTLHYQPEVDLATGAIVGMEALLRWAHPRRGLLPAAAFLPTAAASGLLARVGAWALRACAEEAAAWQRLPPGDSVRQLWVNVAGVQLADPGFADAVGALVEEFRLPAGVLGVEVTEEDLAALGPQVVGLLERLRAAGLALAVDDFGTWYSSLATVGDLPIDGVKLDRSFVRGVGTDLDDDTIVASVVRLAHARDLYVVAEGVESWAESARLCELGCDRAIGYLFSAPATAQRARVLLTRGRGWRRPTDHPVR